MSLFILFIYSDFHFIICNRLCVIVYNQCVVVVIQYLHFILFCFVNLSVQVLKFFSIYFKFFMKKISERIEINTLVNNGNWWAQYNKEYETVDHIPYDDNYISHESDFLLDTAHMMQQLINEQILLYIYGKQTINHDSILWLKHFGTKLYNKCNKVNNTNNLICLTIISKIRMIFKQRKEFITVSDQVLFNIIENFENVSNNINSHSNLWSQIDAYRVGYNKYINNNLKLIEIIQYGLPSAGKYNFLIDDYQSILTYWALIKHNNKQIINTHKINESLNKYSKLEKNTAKHKIGKGGRYTVQSVFNQLDLISKYKIFPNKFKSIGQGIYDMIPSEIRQFLPPLMCGNTIRMYQ